MTDSLDVPTTGAGEAVRGWVLATYRRCRIPALLYALRCRRRLVSLTVYAAITTVSYLAACAVHFDLTWPRAYTAAALASLLLLVPLRLVAGDVCGLSMQGWRFIGASDVRRLVAAVAAGTVVFLPLAWGVGFNPAMPMGVLVLEPVFTLLFTAGLWLSYRTVFELTRRPGSGFGAARKLVIVGAGEAGEAFVRQIIRHPTEYRPVAFVDDDPIRHGTSLHGIEVVGGTGALGEIVERAGADELVIAIPSAQPSDLRRIVEQCDATGLPFRVLPGVAAVFNGDVSLAQLREVRIEDLLGREPVELELPELARDLADQTVLITGAAGSIGSELARQVAWNGPRRLVILDQSETGLFFVELELREAAPEVELIPVVADVVDAAAVERVFIQHQPSRVYHAAAYKHVPMMESNSREALRNNVIGTWRVAAAAGRYGAEKFVLVSTDKAVRPVNIMGATKRLAEMLILELQDQYPATDFGAVRFGNVLGSAGSVIPVFKRQLEAGKPLTVTHPEITRYFMTIPEATQLVLQASLLPELRGRIAMLEMGEPIRIVDLARALVRLSGGSRGRESIVYTGLRPGEKLHEELVAPGEHASATAISKVWILDPDNGVSHNVLARMPAWDRLLTDWRPNPVLKAVRALLPELDARVAIAANVGMNGHATMGRDTAARKRLPVPAGSLAPTRNSTAGANGARRVPGRKDETTSGRHSVPASSTPRVPAG